jgi:hypothetical protein
MSTEILWSFLRGLLWLLFAIATIALVGFATRELFPPFETSPAAMTIVKSSEALQGTLADIGEKNEKFNDALKRATRDDLTNCMHPKTSVERPPAACVDDVLTAARKQSSELAEALSRAHRDIDDNIPRLHNAVDASQQPLWSFFDGIKRFFKWIGPAGFGSVAVAAILGFAITRRSFWANFREGNASLSLGSLTLNFQNIGAVRQSIGERYAKLDADISATYREKIAASDLDKLFANVKEQLDNALKAENALYDPTLFDHRATLFVPNFLGDELIQATGYLGRGFHARTPVVGRRFSVRYGITGMSWRLRHTLYNPTVKTANSRLLRDWGFTRKESATVGTGQTAMAAFVVKSDIPDGNPLGILYLEAIQKVEAFGPDLPGAIDTDGIYDNDKYMNAIWTNVTATNPYTELESALIKLRNEFDWDKKIVQKDGR